MIEKLQSLEKEALGELESVAKPADLEAWRIKYLSRQGLLPSAMEGMKDVPKEQRPEVGKAANQIKSRISAAYEDKKDAAATAGDGAPADPTLPGKDPGRGALHPITQTLHRSISIFRRLGFALADGPHVETEFHNFDALNTPPEHPARNEQDTFYLDLPDHPKFGRYLLRTHTSPVQIRTMMEGEPPIKIIAPGVCYRRDEIDATHGIAFTQLESLVVDRNITLAHLKGTLEFFLRELMGDETRVRFRPHFFPFTEPSFEVDMSTPHLRIKGKEWMEVGGCGMVDPNVFESVGIDPKKFTGFAFGMGIDRIVMSVHGIPDLRLFTENHIRFLEQFA